ncbi:hypothetical protein [Burkholderia sp. Ac-20365]|uniref:hypothetical protein n=1 Tax=Burkholderia sp. Ac-20365 TaxID=2703897 RepID=UPI00197C579D|nr:hypothetical protein [Burkholderia sp. Ac-20365]MBN3761170.1 hypothetical protein [Burkholderia sp. Ac-20365]
MRTISPDPATNALAHQLAQRVAPVVRVDKLSDGERTALFLFASTLPPNAKFKDLVEASAVDAAIKAGINSDSVEHFNPVREALKRAGDRANFPLFELFLSDPRHLAAPGDGSTHMETKCSQCDSRLTWPATSWRDIKNRPHTCDAGHVFAFRRGTFVRKSK